MLAAGDKRISSIDRQRVLQTMGYRADSVVPARILSLINRYAQSSHSLIDPSYSYVFRDLQSVQGDCITIEDSVVFNSQIVAQLLEQCEKVAVFVLTIGDHLEKIVARLAKDKLVLKASVLDAIGSSATEKVADLVHEKISNEVRSQGLSTSRRFSPGYCDWDVGQQEMVFRAMNGDSAGVRLTEECLMLPRKSISGIIGIGTLGINIENYNPCIACLKSDCLGRRV